MPDLEAVGDAATGAGLARAVEPRTGQGDGHTHETNCLNCGTELVGGYCHACGQHAHVHRTLTALWHDLAHGVLHLDGKVWRTLPMLAWRPGELTRRYAHGERAKFVSPTALFLFSVFLMFAVFTIVGGPVLNGAPTGNDGVVTSRDRAEVELNRAREESQAELRALQQEKQRLSSAGQPTGDLDAEIRGKQNEIAIEERLVRGFIPERDAVVTVNASRAADGGLVISSGAKSVDDWFNAAYKKAKENPKLLLYKLQANAYKFSWLLIPISIPLVWLLFLHRRRYRQFTAYDHTVFVTYSIAFMSLAAIALSLLGLLGLPGGLALLAVLIVPPVHIYRQLKGAYGLSRPSALWRTAALMVLSLIAITLFAAILLFLGVFG